MQETEQISEKSFEELNDKYLRVVAEFENYKKRTQKEKQDLVLKTTESLMSTIMDIDNDISIIIQNEKEEKTREVLELVYRKLDNFLKSKNIESIEENEYNPDVHEVISKISGDKEEVKVVSKGYRIGDKIVRYPKVILFTK
jgi:molecular chaperone GrpE